MIAELVIFGLTIASLTTLAIYAITATRRAGDEKAGRAELAARFESMTAQRDNESRRADAEKERADALDDLFASGAVGSHGWDELLQKWRAAHPAAPKGGGGQGSVSAKPASPSPGPDDLLPLE